MTKEVRIMNKEVMIASCGLACMLCSAKLKGDCPGCTEDKSAGCGIKNCCTELKLEGCYKCIKYPCDQKRSDGHRIQAFIESARELGVEQLVACLENNKNQGITYHTEDGSKGDYDQLGTKEEVKALIMKGNNLGTDNE